MNKHVPSISVCMVTYNASPFLRECLDSILSQTFSDYELLIVDDGSTDDTVDIIRSYPDRRIRLIRHRHDYIASLNLLYNNALGKYIARMDADDIMVSDRLQAQYEYMEAHPETDTWAGTCTVSMPGSTIASCLRARTSPCLKCWNNAM